jgi:organic hydroperoxide reductase OsmC/OhrA
MCFVDGRSSEATDVWGKAMSEHRATIKWAHTLGDFLKGSYSREHTWTFDGGVTVPASPAPTSVKPPYSNAANVDPEEAYVAAISSCHMLTFLWVASRKGLEVTSYEDEAIGRMTKNERGIPWVSSVVLRPRVAYSGAHPTSEVEEELHHQAHQGCYIANSVKTEITVDRQLR